MILLATNIGFISYSAFKRINSFFQIEANEVRVLRRVSMKKDQYFIDAKLVARSDVSLSHNFIQFFQKSRIFPFCKF